MKGGSCPGGVCPAEVRKGARRGGGGGGPHGDQLLFRRITDPPVAQRVRRQRSGEKGRGSEKRQTAAQTGCYERRSGPSIASQLQRRGLLPQRKLVDKNTGEG